MVQYTLGKSKTKKGLEIVQRNGKEVVSILTNEG